MVESSRRAEDPIDILVVEDEPAIAESLAYALKRAGFAPHIALTFANAWDAREAAALIVLDLMLPDGSGFDLIEKLRQNGDATPIIVLSSRDGEADRINALEAGADDYVTKPFSPREVVARVRAVLRRLQPAGSPSEPSTVTPLLQLDADTRRARLGNQVLELTRVEFDLLAELMQEPGRVYTRPQLIDSVWGDGFAITDRTVDSHIKSLRRKVNDAGGPTQLIETVRGVGYRVAELPEAAP